MTVTAPGVRARIRPFAACLLPALVSCSRAQEAPEAGVPDSAAARGSASLFGSSPPPRPTGLNKDECPLLPALERALFGATHVVDCGAVPRFAPSGMLRTAQQCVLAAQRAGSAFRVSYAPPSYDSVESAGLARRADGSAVYIHRSSTPTAPWTMRAQLRTSSCRELAVREPCDVHETGDLCLDCLGAGPLRSLCTKLETF